MRIKDEKKLAIGMIFAVSSTGKPIPVKGPDDDSQSTEAMVTDVCDNHVVFTFYKKHKRLYSESFTNIDLMQSGFYKALDAADVRYK